MIVGVYRIVTATALGAATGTTQELKGFLQGITVTPATGTTSYTFTIVDADGDAVFTETAVTGTLVDNTPILIPNQKYTWALSSASANEAFVIKLRVLEALS